MVYIALQNADNIFRSNECFTSINRKYLFVAITQPIITISRSLFKKSLHIFFLLLEKFRSCLKFQIQVICLISTIKVYFNEILFKILESTSQPYDLVMCALEELHRMCSSVKFMSVLFVNYDCDMESHNIFEQLISNFCSIAKNPSSFIRSHPSATPQIFQNILTNTRYICLSCLHNILSLLAERADKLFLKIPSDQTDGMKKFIFLNNINLFFLSNHGVQKEQLQA
ncbi:hypothetical protein HZS_900 [Henneguya salminicola]|nr:hypothetical protein HZS_900 [Henneguya salminicola]